MAMIDFGFGGAGNWLESDDQGGFWEGVIDFGTSVVDLLNRDPAVSQALDTNVPKRRDVYDMPGDDIGGIAVPTNVGSNCCRPGEIAVMVQPILKTIHKAPRGYVIVTDPVTGAKAAMLKEVAKSCGYWKPAPKPFMTGSDVRTISKAGTLVRKFDSMARKMNALTGKANMKRISARPCKVKKN